MSGFWHSSANGHLEKEGNGFVQRRLRTIYIEPSRVIRSLKHLFFISQGNQTLQIRQITLEDQGLYACEVTNKVGKLVEEFRIEVFGWLMAFHKNYLFVL